MPETEAVPAQGSLRECGDTVTSVTAEVLSPLDLALHVKECAGHRHSWLPRSSDVLWPLSLTSAPFLPARGSSG